ncbi:hypothetical protein BX616_005638, partial [Lobosporangium transversale]
MSYVRVNESSDGEDDEISSTPSTQIRRAGSAAAASLASLTGSNALNNYGYSRVGQNTTEDANQERHDLPQQKNHEEEEEEEEEESNQKRNQDRSANDNDIEIHVRFGEGQDLSLRVPRTDTVAQFKEKVKKARPSIGDKYLRLIHAGKILSDNKTLIDSLPKSLFTQIEVSNHQDLQSRISSSVEAVEAAASNILAGISSRTSGGESVGGSHNDNHGKSNAIRTHSSLGSILPTHLSHSSHPEANALSRGGGGGPNSKADPTTHSNSRTGDHISISMPIEPLPITPSSPSAHTSFKTSNKKNTSTIPVQTGPIYFLCSLSDFPPAQRPSEVKKGKAVAHDNSDSGNGVRRTESSRSRSRRLQTNNNIPVPSQSTSAAAARAGASSSLMLPGASSSSSSSSGGSGSSSSAANRISSNGIREVQEEDDHDEVSPPSPVATPQPIGFDRLREAGFSEDEIRSIRRQFHANRGTVTSNVGENGIAVELDEDEDAITRARRVEEEWIDQHGSETLPEGLEGSYGEMVWGLMIGFFMGLIALFWFKEATFSRRQQM